MRKIANITSLVFIVIAVFFFIISLSFPPGSNGAVGPGYFPRIMCVLVVLLSCLQLFNSHRAHVRAVQRGEKEENEEVTIFKKENLRVWITIGITLVYVICVKAIGFVVSSVVFLFAMNAYFRVQEKSKVAFVIIPFAVVAVLYFIFHNLLHVVLPAGLLF